MTVDFSGKNILITGGSRGIGKAIAERLAARGANLFLVARDATALEGTRADILARYPGIACEVYAADVGDAGQVRQAVRRMLETLGAVDGLINNAGIARPRRFEDASFEDFEQLMAVDYFGAVYCTKEVLPHLRSGSFVSFTSSMAGCVGVFGYSTYVGPKFALVGLAETLQQELEPDGIHVSVLCPPDTDTPGLAEEERTKPLETRYLAKQGGLMQPDAVAERFVRQLGRGRFLITVNVASRALYRLHAWAPGLLRRYLAWLIRRARRARQAGALT